MRGDVHHEHVAGRRERDTRLLDIKQCESRQVRVVAHEVAQLLAADVEELGQLAIKEGGDDEHRHGDQGHGRDLEGAAAADRVQQPAPVSDRRVSTAHGVRPLYATNCDY